MTTTAEKTHYEVLELAIDAKPIDIKKAYRRLALKYHPDRNRGSVESTEKFKLISEAYSVLSNPQSRRSYDTALKNPSSAASPRRSNSNHHTNTTTTYTRDPFRQFDDLFRNDPFFHDAFEGMDDVFAARFSQTNTDKQAEEEDRWELCHCGDDSKEIKQSWGEWILNKLGVEVTVTSYSTQVDGSMTKSTYTSSGKTGSTNKQSRSYVDKQGRKVTVMTMVKNGNKLEDIIIAGKIVERRINGVIEPLLSTEANVKESRDNTEAKSISSNSMDRID